MTLVGRFSAVSAKVNVQHGLPVEGLPAVGTHEVAHLVVDVHVAFQGVPVGWKVSRLGCKSGLIEDTY